MLRVISGIYKSRKLKEVKTDSTRPTTDKNKEVLFNTLGQFFEGGKAVDLFAGTGALGIEALSRGFQTCDFIENSFQAVKIIKENLVNLDIKSDVGNVFKQDVFKFLETTSNRYDLIIADPPYKLDCYEDLLNIITSRQLLCDNGIIVLESENTLSLPRSYQDLIVFKEKELGYSKFTLYKKGE
ncbi:MAG: 16S rRNA (guanine(966)-N(2))-methyltransferase RsmD [Candidatus Izemoplasmatales bacterium]|nr:16S rRNA (guanine(966)-N(2))-methyltransferase RsmD [Candidatus Izemoplasmatales bacterium]